MSKTDLPIYRAWGEHFEADTVNMDFVKDALKWPNCEEIARIFWPHGLSEDEGMILEYLLDPWCVRRGSRLEDCLNRHRHLLPLWQPRRLWRILTAAISDHIDNAWYQR